MQDIAYTISNWLYVPLPSRYFCLILFTFLLFSFSLAASSSDSLVPSKLVWWWWWWLDLLTGLSGPWPLPLPVPPPWWAWWCRDLFLPELLVQLELLSSSAADERMVNDCWRLGARLCCSEGVFGLLLAPEEEEEEAEVTCLLGALATKHMVHGWPHAHSIIYSLKKRKTLINHLVEILQTRQSMPV